MAEGGAHGESVTIDGHQLTITHRDKVFFPGTGQTKGELIDYYDRVAAILVPHLAHRPVSLQRFPDGLDGEGFYQKEAPGYFPGWIPRVRFPRREGGHFLAPRIDSRAVLVYLANQAMITPHCYLSPADDLEHPDRMIFDLDPPGGRGEEAGVGRAALDLRDLLAELSMTAWVQTTGSRGFHVVVPLDGGEDFDTVRGFARDVARVLVRRQPARYTLAQRKAQRRGRLFLDVLRNAYGATAVAPYAVRAREGAPVATPLSWAEVEGGAAPRDWTMRNLLRRLGQKADPWQDLGKRRHRLDAHRRALATRLDREAPADEEG